MVKSPGQPHDTQRHLVLMSYRGCRPRKSLAEEVFGLPPRVPSSKGTSRAWGGTPVFPPCHVSPARLENSRDAEEAEVCDHHLPVVVENIF